MKPAKRCEAWNTCRMFFLTPQVLNNDLVAGICPAAHIRCLVVDEAHKATGNYSYCTVVQELTKANAVYRILALSATPGSDIEVSFFVDVYFNCWFTVNFIHRLDIPEEVDQNTVIIFLN